MQVQLMSTPFSQLENGLAMSYHSKDRKFTDLRIPLSTALDRIVAKGHLKVLDARPPPNPLPPNFWEALYCKYHQSKGHSIERCFCLRHAIEELIEKKIISPLPVSQPNVTKNPLPNHHTIQPPRNINYLEEGDEEFDTSVLITPNGHLNFTYDIPKGDHKCIIRGIEDVWLEGREEEEEFEQDLIEDVMTLEWWDPANPTTIWYEEEKMTKLVKDEDLWYRGNDDEVNDLWA